MLRQYQELKRQHPGTILFFRLGDFYELFFDDAVTGARELEITLTARHKERGATIPMCGVPHHAVAGYVARLIRKGYRVAICEQTEDPTKTKKLVRREVVRVITPGTAFDPHLVEAGETIYLAAVCGAGDTYGAAFLDLSTGEFRATEASGPDAWPRIRAHIESYAPRELLFPESLKLLVQDSYAGLGARTTPLPLNQQYSDGVAPVARISPPDHATTNGDGMALTPIDDWLWEPLSCASLLLEQFGVRTLEGYGLNKKTDAVSAAGVCLRYARETQRAAAAHVTEINYFEEHDYLVLDAVTCRNLELTETQSGDGRGHTLLNALDATVTGMGARLLRNWMLRPSVRRGEIEARLSAVEDLYGSQMKRDRTRALLREVSDLERLVGRINMGTANARDLVALRRSLDQVPAIRQTLSDAEASLLQIIVENTDELADVRELIAKSIGDEPPLNIADLGVIRDGYEPELDELRTISRDAKQIIAGIESRERARTGIATLRVRFNNVFGYFIEVSKTSAARVPADYERKQTLANAERYTTRELKDWEQKVLGADGHMMEIEARLFGEIRARVALETKRLQATARALSILENAVLPRANENIKTLRAVYEIGEIKITDLIAEQRRLLEIVAAQPSPAERLRGRQRRQLRIRLQAAEQVAVARDRDRLAARLDQRHREPLGDRDLQGVRRARVDGYRCDGGEAAGHFAQLGVVDVHRRHPLSCALERGGHLRRVRGDAADLHLVDAEQRRVAKPEEVAGDQQDAEQPEGRETAAGDLRTRDHSAQSSGHSTSPST